MSERLRKSDFPSAIEYEAAAGEEGETARLLDVWFEAIRDLVRDGGFDARKHEAASQKAMLDHIQSIRSQLSAREQRIRDLEGERRDLEWSNGRLTARVESLLAAERLLEERVTVAEREVAEGKRDRETLRAVVEETRELFHEWRDHSDKLGDQARGSAYNHGAVIVARILEAIDAAPVDGTIEPPVLDREVDNE